MEEQKKMNQEGETFIVNLKKREDLKRKLSEADRRLDVYIGDYLREICELLVFKKQLENDASRQEKPAVYIPAIELYDFAEPSVEFHDFANGAQIKVEWKEDYNYEFKKYDDRYEILVPVEYFAKSDEELENELGELKQIAENNRIRLKAAEAETLRQSELETYRKLKEKFGAGEVVEA